MEQGHRSTHEPGATLGTVTRLLADWQRGEDQALAYAVDAIYGELRRIAARLLRSEKRAVTLDTLSLVHEAYLQLVRQDRTTWSSRGHFLAMAAQIMRRYLVDRARSRQCAKRGSGAASTTLDGKAIYADDRPLDILALDAALSDLARDEPRLAHLVEMRFFGGLTNDEIAEEMGVTSMTIIRRWRLARAWLRRYLTQNSGHAV